MVSTLKRVTLNMFSWLAPNVPRSRGIPPITIAVAVVTATWQVTIRWQRLVWLVTMVTTLSKILNHLFVSGSKIVLVIVNYIGNQKFWVFTVCYVFQTNWIPISGGILYWPVLPGNYVFLQYKMPIFQVGVPQINQFHKSCNAPVPYPTIHLAEYKYAQL